MGPCRAPSKWLRSCKIANGEPSRRKKEFSRICVTAPRDRLSRPPTLARLASFVQNLRNRGYILGVSYDFDRSGPVDAPRHSRILEFSDSVPCIYPAKRLTSVYPWRFSCTLYAVRCTPSPPSRCSPRPSSTPMSGSFDTRPIQKVRSPSATSATFGRPTKTALASSGSRTTRLEIYIRDFRPTATGSRSPPTERATTTSISSRRPAASRASSPSTPPTIT